MVTEAAQEETSFLDGGSFPEETVLFPTSHGDTQVPNPSESGARIFFMAFPFPVAHRGQFMDLPHLHVN